MELKIKAIIYIHKFEFDSLIISNRLQSNIIRLLIILKNNLAFWKHCIFIYAMNNEFVTLHSLRQIDFRLKLYLEIISQNIFKRKIAFLNVKRILLHRQETVT